MTDLQIALALLGAAVIAAVFAHNAWQERRLRRRLEQAFEGQRGDILQQRGAQPPLPAPRVEPSIGIGPAAVTARIPAAGGELLPDGAEAVIECFATIECRQAPGEAALRELHQAIAVFGKPARLLGEDAAAGGWRVLGREARGGHQRLQATLQLANRSGALHAPQLNGFCDALRGWCARNGAEVRLPETAQTLKAALSLDSFCAETDVVIGLSIMAQPGGAFSGGEVRVAAEAEGFRLETDGVFYRSDAVGDTLFTLENQQARPFLADAVDTLQTTGLTLLLDLPRVADAETLLEQMAACGGRLAQALGGKLVDDNRVPLQAESLARIKAQLRAIQTAMAAREIPAGSARARRLFA